MAAFARHHLPTLPQTGPEVKPGQGGRQRALPRPLRKHWSSVPAAPASSLPGCQRGSFRLMERADGRQQAGRHC